ncbi:MAG: hypothetical protein ACYCOU_20635 [Sulfobacillus sp.]
MQATILKFSADDEDFDGNKLGPDVVLVSVNGALAAGADRDVSELVPEANKSSENKSSEKDEKKAKPKAKKVTIEQLRVTLWKKAWIRASAEYIAKARRAAEKAAASASSSSAANKGGMDDD